MLKDRDKNIHKLQNLSNPKKKQKEFQTSDFFGLWSLTFVTKSVEKSYYLRWPRGMFAGSSGMIPFLLNRLYLNTGIPRF